LVLHHHTGQAALTGCSKCQTLQINKQVICSLSRSDRANDELS